MRKDWDTYFMDIADMVAERSTCLRRHVGAVVVKDKRIKGTGYNGSPAGLPHCSDIGCEMVAEHCIRCVHAEPNALLECGPEERKAATIYCTDRPCPECQKLIITSGISRIVYGREYEPHTDWIKLAPWIEVVHINRPEQ